MQVYQQLQIPKLALQTLNHQLSIYENPTLQDTDYHLEHYKLLEQLYGFTSIQSPASEQPIARMSVALDYYYFSEKLRLACLALAHGKIYKSGYQIHLMPDIIQHVQQHQLHVVPSIGIYYYIFLAMSTGQSVYFQQFREQITQHNHLFSLQTVRDIYMLAINFYIRSMNDGKMEDVHNVLALYKQGLMQGFLFENKILSRFTFINIVRISLKCEDVEWVKTFIETYKTNLEPGYQHSIYQFSLAAISFYEKRFGQVIVHLQHFKSNDILMNLSAKTLLMKAYYELQEIEVLHSHLDAMKNYLHRNKMLGYHKEKLFKNYLLHQEIITN
ncbi:MAG: hypothetical protein HC892_18590 [Saprospiraceae bacterium]|nr:hypothetical protein [Saprospiraceae bacterium]